MQLRRPQTRAEFIKRLVADKQPNRTLVPSTQKPQVQRRKGKEA